MAHPNPNTESPDPDSADPALIDAALAGDTVAFGHLVVRYQDRLCNALMRFTGSADDAQDVAQDAFVQAYKKLDRFRRDSQFYTWLYRIAFNRAVSISRKRRERASIHSENAPEPTSHAASPEAPAETKENVALVHQALATLAEDHRQVLVLREFDDMDYAEIAEVIGKPVGTVRSRLSRARNALRDALVRLGVTDGACSGETAT